MGNPYFSQTLILEWSETFDREGSEKNNYQIRKGFVSTSQTKGRNGMSLGSLLQTVVVEFKTLGDPILVPQGPLLAPKGYFSHTALTCGSGPSVWNLGCPCVGP